MNVGPGKNSEWATGPFIGRPLPRFEDFRLVRGEGRFSDDIFFDGQAYAAFVRSPHAHARLLGIDPTMALHHDGVLAVLSGSDYLGQGHKGISHGPVPADAVDHRRPAFETTSERPIFAAAQSPFAIERVRYCGEIVAMVVAESAAFARRGAELVQITYDPLPAVVDARDALLADAPLVWTGAPGNVALAAEFGDRAATDAALSVASFIVEQTFVNQRIVTAQMEPRVAIGLHDRARDRYTLVSGSQGSHKLRQGLAQCLRVAGAQVRVVCPDVGGAFGTRTNLYPEQVAVVWATAHVGRPVKWTSDRSEAFLSDYQGRDLVTNARLGFDRDGRILGFSADLVGNVGAHPVSFVPLHNSYRIATTVYRIAASHVRLRGILTNTVPTAPYRGAGRPEATLVIERLLDIAARRMSIDRLDLRRRNLIRPADLPYRTVSALSYDSGAFATNFETIVRLADWAGFAERRKQAEARGLLAGIGVANYVECPVGAPHERVEIRVAAAGVIELVVGTQSSGQGHETSFAQVVADQLGVRPQDVRCIGGDTDLVESGGGTQSDRSMRIVGTLAAEAAAKVIAQARRAAAVLLDVDETAIRHVEGLFVTDGHNRRLSVFDIAQAMEEDERIPGRLAAAAVLNGRIPAYPTGAAICEVAIDAATGQTKICRYTSIDDAGQPINPLILHGQVHGGIAQGVGQALCEGIVHDPTSAQMLNGSFMDYGMPRADMFPLFDVALTEDQTHGNPLRIKGGGEGVLRPPRRP